MTVEKNQRVVALNRLIDSTRLLFHQLKAAARDLHGGSELTGGLRGVLLQLYRTGPQTVPQMAKSRPVSRQHIQTLVNELLAQSLVELRPNPAHKRSRMVALTPKGARRIEGMLAREAQALERLPLDVSPAALMEVAQTLETVRESFRGTAWTEITTAD